jgi:hypothetical protein
LIESIEFNYGKNFSYDFNAIIYEALSTIAYEFIEENQSLFKDKSDKFEFHINYLDSHVRFIDDEIQKEFEKIF